MRRTRYTNRMGTLLFLLILVVPGAYAQRSREARFASRDNDGGNRNYENSRDRGERNDNFSRNNRNDKSVYFADNDHRERHGKKFDNDDRRYDNRRDGYREDRYDKEPRGHAYGHYKKEVVVREYADRPAYMHRHRCFHNPQYGWVVSRFASDPIVIRERDSDYYYSDGTFYRYHPRVGYIVAEAPYDAYVNELPDGCRRVRVNGEIYFSLGNIFFSPVGDGFRMVHPPVGNLSFSFRF